MYHSLGIHQRTGYFRAQQLELIYSQYRILKKVFHDSPQSKIDLTILKSAPHAEGIIRSINNSTANLLSQLQQLSLQISSSIQVSFSVHMHSEPSAIKDVQSSNYKGNQQSDGKKRDMVRIKIRMVRVMRTNPVVILGRLKRSLKIKLSFLEILQWTLFNSYFP